MNSEELYRELRGIACRIEEIRVLLYNDTAHHSTFQDEDFKSFDDGLFHIQSDLRDFANWGSGDF